MRNVEAVCPLVSGEAEQCVQVQQGARPSFLFPLFCFVLFNRGRNMISEKRHTPVKSSTLVPVIMASRVSCLC